MEIDVIEITEFSSDDFLEMALRCRHNSIVLKDSAKLLQQNESSKRHGLFLYYTASENVRKAFFLQGLYDILRLKSRKMGDSVYEKYAEKFVERIAVLLRGDSQ